MDERVLVTGSTGFIGSRTVDALLKRGIAVRVMLRPQSVSVGDGLQGVEVCRAGYHDRVALGRAVEGVTRVIHLAGVTKAVDEEGYRAGNVVPVENLLSAVREYNPSLERFTLVSSLAAAGPAEIPWPGVRESALPGPVSAYGRSKLLGEEAALKHAANVPLTIVRPPAVYGPGDRDILEVFLMMKKGVLLSAGAGAKQRFSMIHVDDLVEGMLLASFEPSAVGETYFITSPQAYSWDDVIDASRSVLGFRRLMRLNLPVPLVFVLGTVLGAAARMTGKPALISRDKARELVRDYWVCSPEKAYRELGFSARTPLDEGIASTLHWYRAHGWIQDA